MSVSRVNLPQLAIGEKVYNNVLCIIVDLQGKAKEYAPSFIIGADIVSRDLWNIDLKNSCFIVPHRITPAKAEDKMGKPESHIS